MDTPDRTTIEARLFDLARNHRWTWHQPAARILAAIPGAADGVHPVTTLDRLDPTGWATIAADADLVAAIEAEHHDLQALLATKPPQTDIAYVSAEFGISELVPQYSGGLGILAGDHLKSASDLNLPLAGVGLFYREGFFRQELDGVHQTERYERCDPAGLGFVDTGAVVTVDVAGDPVDARVWRLAIGRIDLYALDTDLPGNTRAGRAITDRLYSGDEEHRVRQELILGIGGLRALRAVGIEPEVVHLNEGHAGFLLLERMEAHLSAGRTLDEAVELTRAGAVFTTHTPVPAGIDRFEPSLIETHLGPWAEANDVPLETLLELGTSPDDEGDPKPFNMAAFCLALTGAANGVSKLHGEVSRRLFASVPAGPVADRVDHQRGPCQDLGRRRRRRPADRLTSARSWHRRAVPRRMGRGPGEIDHARHLGNPLGRTAGPPGRRGRRRRHRHTTNPRSRRALTDRVRPPLRHLQAGQPPARPRSPRLKADLLTDDSTGPVQFVFAGKAHPADGRRQGSHVARSTRVSRDSDRRPPAGSCCLPDYDIGIARARCTHGCDVWLNNADRTPDGGVRYQR